MKKTIPVIAAGLLLAVLVWWFSSDSIKLDDDSYEIAIALYRVCNQKDDSGLDSIRVRLAELDESDSREREVRVLQEIIDTAEKDWESAMKRTRSLLDDQVAHQ